MTPAISQDVPRFFTLQELRRAGVAATMIVVCGTLIIVAITMMLGHYSTLSHCGPKAVLDGAVVAMLLGNRGRWRCLALLGVVYGFVLLLQIGVLYLLPVMAFAGLLGAMAGWLVSWLHRGAALAAAAATYELFCGFGAPIQIYFGTGGSHEPVIWGLWLLEWPLRIGGATIGVWFMGRWLKSRKPAESFPAVRVESSPPHRPFNQLRLTQNRRDAFVRLALCIIACTVPMGINSPTVLGGIGLFFVVYAWFVGVRRRILHAAAGLCWGWLAFGLMSYLWHHDVHRVLDLGRTLVLRFLPLTLASLVLASTVRPIDLIRLLRKLRLSSAVLIPLSTVARNLPRSRQMAHRSIDELKSRALWKGPASLLRRPIPVLRTLLGDQLSIWIDQLIEKPAEPVQAADESANHGDMECEDGQESFHASSPLLHDATQPNAAIAAKTTMTAEQCQ
jgi:hypothetical protein